MIVFDSTTTARSSSGLVNTLGLPGIILLAAHIFCELAGETGSVGEIGQSCGRTIVLEDGVKVYMII